MDLDCSESELEAQKSLRTLQHTIQVLSEQNQWILRRFEQHNIHLGVGGASIRFLEDDRSTIRPEMITHEEERLASYPPDFRSLMTKL